MGLIEDIILSDDQRGIGALRRHLPDDFTTEASRFILQRPGRALIATGFYIVKARAGETDGPPGAVAIGSALSALGYRVVYVTDGPNLPLVRALADREEQVVEFPLAGHRESRAFASDLLRREGPTVLVVIERVGFTSGRRYLNREGLDVSRTMAKLDYLFLDREDTVGIGDGGNEIGMGLVAEHVAAAGLTRFPCTTATARLVLGSTSNWGGYGLVAALSVLSGRDLLPQVAQERQWIARLVQAGAVDGILGQRQETVDGKDPRETVRVLEALHRHVQESLGHR